MDERRIRKLVQDTMKSNGIHMRRELVSLLVSILSHGKIGVTWDVWRDEYDAMKRIAHFMGAEEILLRCLYGSRIFPIIRVNTRTAAPTKLQRAGIYSIELLCRPEDRDGIVGDLLERYEEMLALHGKRRADWWFRVQVFWSMLECLEGRLRRLPAIGAALVLITSTWRKIFT